MSRPRAALIAVGDELLSGAQVDTNSSTLARKLGALGIEVESIELVGDDEEPVAEAVLRALARAELVCVGGGLGPTLDDVTRHGVARALSLELHEDPEALSEVRRWFERRGLPMNDANRRQALLPRGARLWRNSAGTAPCFVVERGGGRAVLVLPGPPRELEVVWREQAEPWLAERGWVSQALDEQHFYLFGIPESVFAERCGAWMARDADPRMGCTVRDGTLTAALRARELSAPSHSRLLARVEEFRARFGAEIYSEREWALEQVLVAELAARAFTVTVAESCTGGLVLEHLTRVPGASRVLAQGFVTYADAAKTALLGVPRELLERHGAVSREVAEAMALGAARASGAELALAVTGIAGPDGGTSEKPVGMVWFATVLADRVASVLRRFPPVGREPIRRVAARTALHLGWKRLVARGAD
jgi:nicotinamide-nucleotide amidase